MAQLMRGKRRGTCPRRMSEYGPWKHEEGLDGWSQGHGLVTQQHVGESCTFCGSLHPDRFMELIREGWIVGPTDKTYKAYLARPGQADGGGGTEAKFYYQHLGEEQRAEFIELYNARRLTIGYPGYLYVLPFFCQPTEH